MQEPEPQGQPPLVAAANAIVKLHKEHFGRGPTKARAHFTGPDILTCSLTEALLPAERRMTELGLQDQVRQSRVSFQAAVQSEFIAAIEAILQRKVFSFASAVDPDRHMVFEIFQFEPREQDSRLHAAEDPGAPQIE